MPSYPPRGETVKKKEEVLKRQRELLCVIERQESELNLNKATDKLKKANLSLCKAKIHVIREKQLQKKPYNMTIEKIENEILKWETISKDEIIKTAIKNNNK